MKVVETFVPLYISNRCDGYCTICNMRTTNNKLKRKAGTKRQILNQLDIIFNVEKVKAICFLTGEFNFGHLREDNFSLIIWCIQNAIDFGFEKVYINIGALSDNEISKLYSTFGNIQDKLVLSLFQETYNNTIYQKYFCKPKSNHPKSDFDFRYSTPERWLLKGFKNIDMGILVGLYDFDKEIELLLLHAISLHKKGANINISLPRIKGTVKTAHLVPDKVYRDRIIKLSRQLKWIKIIITTRESIGFINSIKNYFDVISPGTSDVLPYNKTGLIPNDISTSQFQVAKYRMRPSSVLNELQFDNIKYYEPI